ncbi:MAG: hypothetical protein ACRED1_13725, partial [Limisphaerales bacterium]
LILETWLAGQPASVIEQTGSETAGGGNLPRMSADELAKAPVGWAWTNGLLIIKVNDRFEAMRFKASNTGS